MDTGEHVCCKKTHFRQGEDFFVNRSIETTVPHLHSHDCVEIAYVTSGEGTHIFGNETYIVHKGDLFIVNCGVQHEFRKIKDNNPLNPLVVYNCIFTARFLDDNLTDSGDFYSLKNMYFLRNMFNNCNTSESIKIMNKDSAEIEELYEKMLKEYTSKRNGYSELIRAYIIELIIKVMRLSHEQHSQDNKSYLKHHKMFDKVMDYIRNNSSSSITINELAGIFNYSPNYLSKLFKSYTGMGLSEYIQKVRIEKACTLLQEDHERSVLQIANEVGYNDIKFFNKIFRRIAGKTPSQFRCEVV